MKFIDSTRESTDMLITSIPAGGIRLALASLLASLFSVAALAQTNVMVESIAEALSAATDIAVPPEGDGVWVVESGTGEILSVDHDERRIRINGFRSEAHPDAPQALAIHFSAERRLVVGCQLIAGGRLQFLEFDLRQGSQPQPAGDASREKHELELDAADAESAAAMRDLVGNQHRFHFLVAGGNGASRIGRADTARGVITNVTWCAELESLLRQGPVEAMCLSIQLDLVLLQRTGDGATRKLVFCDWLDGKPVAEYTVDVSDITALATSPRTGRLFAADRKRGIGRLSVDPDDASRCRWDLVFAAPDIADLEFNRRGELFVLTREANSKSAVLRLTGLDD